MASSPDGDGGSEHTENCNLEIRFGGHTPPKVAINEAVEIAKIFGADGTPKFVNGVLGSVMEEVKETL